MLRYNTYMYIFICKNIHMDISWNAYLHVCISSTIYTSLYIYTYILLCRHIYEQI